jgi:hypothetical protein
VFRIIQPTEARKEKAMREEQNYLLRYTTIEKVETLLRELANELQVVISLGHFHTPDATRRFFHVSLGPNEEHRLGIVEIMQKPGENVLMRVDPQPTNDIAVREQFG